MKLRKIGKKLVSTALVAALGMSLTACGSSSSDGEKTGNEGGKLTSIKMVVSTEKKSS